MTQHAYAIYGAEINGKRPLLDYGIAGDKNALTPSALNVMVLVPQERTDTIVDTSDSPKYACTGR